ncbi:unnamed protein product [Closterium sp. Yama58-4]|nr:unnamed protein product [Closterium sp. Yama58-4]
MSSAQRGRSTSAPISSRQASSRREKQRYGVWNLPHVFAGSSGDAAAAGSSGPSQCLHSDLRRHHYHRSDRHRHHRHHRHRRHRRRRHYCHCFLRRPRLHHRPHSHQRSRHRSLQHRLPPHLPHLLPPQCHHHHFCPPCPCRCGASHQE